MEAAGLLTAAQAAENVEKLGIIGVLALLLGFMVILYFRESKKNSETLLEVKNDIKQLIQKLEDHSNRSFALLADTIREISKRRGGE